jgi:hypothetical protein
MKDLFALFSRFNDFFSLGKIQISNSNLRHAKLVLFVVDTVLAQK